ncbi:hypothetical protein HDE_05035 [Halotydeus destructor]|nr:hypothetical protein HDE_05035 [Halotydeus destructor]
MKFFVAFALLVVAVQADSDAEYWIAKSEINANSKLSEWKTSANDLAQGSDERVQLAKVVISKLLAPLADQLKDARDNSRTLIRTISAVIGGLTKLTEGTHNILRDLGLRGTLAVLGDKRDNKSYYLLDGAQNWAGLRADALNSCTSEYCVKLVKALTAIQANIIATREALEERAQNFVANRKKLNELKDSDLKQNFQAIQDTVKAMAANPEKGTRFLELSEKVYQEATQLARQFSS